MTYPFRGESEFYVPSLRCRYFFYEISDDDETEPWRGDQASTHADANGQADITGGQ